MSTVLTRPARDLRNSYAEKDDVLHFRYVADKLAEAEAEAASPDAVWTDWKAVLRRTTKAYGEV